MGKTYNLLLYFLLIVLFFGMSLFLKRPFIWLGFFIMITSTLRSYDKNDKIEKLLIYLRIIKKHNYACTKLILTAIKDFNNNKLGMHDVYKPGWTFKKKYGMAPSKYRTGKLKERG